MVASGVGVDGSVVAGRVDKYGAVGGMLGRRGDSNDWEEGRRKRAELEWCGNNPA